MEGLKGGFCSKMSKSFTENLLHGGGAIWSEKWPFWPLTQPSSDEKSGRRRRKFAHIPYFCARFLRKFSPFSRFCKHAKFSKVNAKFSKVVDFFFSTKPLFCKIQINPLTINHLSNLQKTGLFSSKSFFVENFRNMEAKNGCFVKIVQKKEEERNCTLTVWFFVRPRQFYLHHSLQRSCRSRSVWCEWAISCSAVPMVERSK